MTALMIVRREPLDAALRTFIISVIVVFDILSRN